MKSVFTAIFASSFPRRRESLFVTFAATWPESDSRLRGNDDLKLLDLRKLALLILLLLPAFAFAQVSDPTPLQFRDATEEARFHQLASELRCVQCQNQSLADSNAQIAHDLRREVLAQIHAGKSDAQIKRFLVERYGEFVLYKPRMEGRTWLLWLGPLALLAVGGFVIVRIVRRRSKAEIPADDGQEW